MFIYVPRLEVKNRTNAKSNLFSVRFLQSSTVNSMLFLNGPYYLWSIGNFTKFYENVRTCVDSVTWSHRLQFWCLIVFLWPRLWCFQIGGKRNSPIPSDSSCFDAKLPPSLPAKNIIWNYLQLRRTTSAQSLTTAVTTIKQHSTLNINQVTHGCLQLAINRIAFHALRASAQSGVATAISYFWSPFYRQWF